MRLVLLLAALLVSASASSQGVPEWAAPAAPEAPAENAMNGPGPPPPPPPPPPVPVDGGLGLLLLAGAGYGAHRLRGKRA